MRPRGLQGSVWLPTLGGRARRFACLIVSAVLSSGLPAWQAQACPRHFSGAWNYCGDERPAGKWFDPTAAADFEVVAVATATRMKRFLLTSDGPIVVSEAKFWEARDSFTETETELEITAVLKGEIGKVTHVRTSRAGVCGPNGPVFALGRQYVLYFTSTGGSARNSPSPELASAAGTPLPPGMAFAACYQPDASWYQRLIRQLGHGTSTGQPGN